MVKDLKGHLAHEGRKAQTPGWLVLVVSHMVIFTVGIALGHWICGRLATVAPTEMVPSGQRETSESIPRIDDRKTADDTTSGHEVSADAASRDRAEEPEFTFYESLKRDNHGAESPSPTVEETRSSEPPPPPDLEVAEQEKSPHVTGTVYYVQVASFREEKRAEILAGELRKKGYTARVFLGVAPGKGLWHRVRVGPFESIVEAQDVAEDVTEKERFRPLIVKDKGEAPS